MTPPPPYPTPSWPSPWGGAASPLAHDATNSPTPATPHRRFPSPSPTKHIRVALCRHRAPKETQILEELDGERRMDKSFRYGKNLAARCEIGKEIRRGHFGHTCSARAKKGEIKGQTVTVKLIAKSKLTNDWFTLEDLEDFQKEINTFLVIHAMWTF